MSFTVIVPYFNGQKYIQKLLDTIPEQIPVIIVDDLSDSQPSIERSNVTVISSTKKGYFTGATNIGIKSCKDDVLILNQDTYFSGNGWLNFIEQKKNTFGLFGERAGTHPAWPNRYVHGTFMYIRRDMINKIGLMDEVNYPHWGSTCEYQLRACRNGFKALPVEDIPNFVHLRKGPYGSATKQVLTGKKSLLIRTPPQISVIVTCYNYGKYLQDTVNSLIGGETSLGKTKGQTRQDFEIIIVDDGSTDNSLEIIEQLADDWQGIHYISQANQGSAAACNTGIIASHARSGHYISILDADDMMKPGRLARMVRTYEANPHSLIYDNLQYFAHGQEGVVTDWETMKKYDVLDLGTYNFDEIVHKNTMHKGLLYPKQAWEDVGGYPVIMNKGREDWAFNVGAGIKGWCGVNTREAEYLYRREGQNRTLTNTNPRWRRVFLEQLKQLYPSIYAGERPMGCCGSGRKSASAKVSSVKSAKLDLLGKDGMVILEYVGANWGDETWRGPVTQTKYVIGGVSKQKYVDKRDAYGEGRTPGMLSIEKNGKKQFKEIKPQKIVVPEPKVEIVEEVVEVATLDEVEEVESVEEVKKIETPNPDEMTVTAIKEVLPLLDTDQLEIVLNAEFEGRGRTTAINAIKDAIDERSS